nr:hypothetical protein CFP56_56716 [Quercus suber]
MQGAALCIRTPEWLLIRNTIMQHEALFKEQVQALHKLYNIQKSAMQEIKIYSQAQILACSSKGFVLLDDRYSSSVLDEKHLRPTYATGQAYKDESLSLSLHPFYALDHKGCDSEWINSRGVETLQTAQSKPIRNFDLEKLPEDCMDESEYQIEPNSSKMSDENSILLKRTTNADGDSSVKENLSAIQMGSPSLKQIYPKTNISILSENGQEIIQNCDRVSEDKAYRNEIKRFALSFLTPNNTSENKTSQDFPRKCLPAGAKSDLCQYSMHIEKPTVLHQGFVNFMTQKYNTLDSGEDSLQKILALANGHIVEGFFPKNPVICSQGSSTLDSVQHDSTYCKGFAIQRSLSLKSNSISGKQDLNSFPLSSQTSTYHKDENQNDSDNGSNSVHSHYMKRCKEKNIIIQLEDSPGPGDGCCEAVQKSHGGGQAVQSECEEVPQVIKDGLKVLVSSTHSDSEVKHVESNKSPQDEAFESIAAEILLSMAPSAAQVDIQMHGTQTKVELHKASEENMISDKTWNPCQRRHANYCQDGESESLKWVKTVNRRRTARRPR